MSIFNGNLIRKKQHIILNLLYMFRGVTNEQLRRYLYSHLKSKPTGQLANVSRFVSELKDFKLIKSISCHPHSKEELNFLSRNGIEYIHEFCDIENECFENVVGFSIKGSFKSFEYNILSPPTHYIEHHLMFVDVAIDYKNVGLFRHNLYSVKKYEYAEFDVQYGYKKRGKLKPDGELLTHKGHLLAIEIDTGTERFDKLVEKFTNYRRYFDYCTENELEIPWLGIAFHTKRGNEKLDIEEDLRWQTILKAAAEGLSYYCWEIDILGFKRQQFIKMMKNEPERLANLGIKLPQQQNPVSIKKQQREENKRKEEIRKQKESEDFQRRKKENEEYLRQQRLLEKIRLEDRERIAEEKRLEEENRKKGILGWLR